jgi:hypothetical protein
LGWVETKVVQSHLTACHNEIPQTLLGQPDPPRKRYRTTPPAKAQDQKDKYYLVGECCKSNQTCPFFVESTNLNRKTDLRVVVYGLLEGETCAEL